MFQKIKYISQNKHNKIINIFKRLKNLQPSHISDNKLKKHFDFWLLKHIAASINGRCKFKAYSRNIDIKD